MIACVLLVTLANAADHTAVKTALKAGEHLTSAATLVKAYFHEQDWPFEKALSAMGPSVPAEVMSMLKKEGVAGTKKFLHPTAGLLQEDDSKKKGVEWTTEELDRAKVILNRMYDTEQSELDVLLFDCKQYIDGVQGQMDENARIRLILGEETATARADQLEATKSKKESEGQLEGLKEEYEAHQAMCHQTLTAKNAELTMAELDYNVALKIQNMSACDDAQIQAAIAMDESPPPAALVAANSTLNKAQTIMACQTGDGDDGEEFLLLGGMHGNHFHTKAARFAMQRAAKLAMERDLGEHSYEHKHPWVLLDTTMATTTTGVDPMAALSEGPPPEEASPPKELEPEGHKCNVNAVPNCPLLADAISTMVGELRDAFVTIKTDYEATLAHCNALSADFEAQISDWQSIHDRAEVTLAKAITTIDTNQAEGAAKAKEYAELETQFNMKTEECETKKTAILDTMCGIKVVRLELYKLAEKPEMFVDCDVGDWVPGECSVSCAGGTQILSREVLAEPSGGAECPPLQMEQACNEHPCPIDCEVDEWSGFSACSKDCGGGVMSRSRNIQQEPEFGGEECPPTSDAVMCNVDACDQPCVIGDWSEWSDCSKACGGGILVRRKPEITAALGAGTCPHPDSPERFEQMPCNDDACDNNVVCGSKIDLVLLLDGSGSVRSKGFKQELEFADSLLSRMHYGEDFGKAAVIKFSKKIEVVGEMSFDKDALIAETSATKWPAKTTNTAEGLSRALDILAAGGRASAQSVVFVLTDGMPNDVEATAMMAEKVKEKARLVFVAVGKNLDMDALYTWASFPPEFNVLTAKKFSTLITKVGDFMADLCPVLQCDETLEGNGENYIGCQTMTVTGKQCQEWDEKFPQKHKKRGAAKKGRFGLGRNNFCRNPKGKKDSIWCYTTDPSSRWELCEPRNTTEPYQPYVAR